MTIEDMKQRKRDLSVALITLVKAFEEETGVTVENLRVKRIPMTTWGKGDWSILDSINVEVGLEDR